MIGYVFIAAGAMLFIAALMLLFKDSYRGYGATMGGEMLAGVLWASGSVSFSAGLCVMVDASLFFAAPSAILLYLVGMPCRIGVARLGCRYGKHPPRLQDSFRPGKAMKQEKDKKI